MPVENISRALPAARGDQMRPSSRKAIMRLSRTDHKPSLQARISFHLVEDAGLQTLPETLSDRSMRGLEWAASSATIFGRVILVLRERRPPPRASHRR